MSLCFVKPNIFTYKFYRLISIHFLFKAFSLLKLVIISLILITFSLHGVLVLLGERWWWSLLGFIKGEITVEFWGNSEGDPGGGLRGLPPPPPLGSFWNCLVTVGWWSRSHKGRRTFHFPNPLEMRYVDGKQSGSQQRGSFQTTFYLAIGDFDEDAFPNTLPITSAEAERSFSSMKRIKTCSRSTMS